VDTNHKKEQFANAYVRAVAAVSGYTCYKPEPDTDSVDWGIAAIGGNGTRRSPRLELQLKCTAHGSFGDDNCLHYPLKLKNYNDLRPSNLMVPRLLVVVTIPEDISDWLVQSEDQMILRRCGYWLSLKGLPDTTNENKVTVPLPRSNIFSVESLNAMMSRIENGGDP